MRLSSISFLIFLMKTFLKTTGLALFTVALVGCSGAAEQPTPSSNTDDHHQGEINVAPHGHDDDVMQQMMDDHHKGETNVMPHGHDDEGNSMMDDHHAGEENVEPHEHDDANTNLPPSRSRLENDDHHEGEENVAPHGH